MIKLKISFFCSEEDNNAISIETRINEIVKLLQNENEYLQFEDGTTCYNEEELRNFLKGKHIL